MTNTHRSPLPARAFVAFALACAAALPARAQDASLEPVAAAPTGLPRWSWETTPSHLRIAAALRAARRAGPNDGPELIEKVASSGRDSVAAAVDILLRGRVPETNPNDGPQLVSDAQRGVLLAALARMPAKAVQRELDARLAKTPDDDRARVGAMYALGTVGEAQDIARLVELAPWSLQGETKVLSFDAREALRLSTQSLLRRSPQAWTALATVLRTAELQPAQQLIDALARSSDPRALRVLLATARDNPKLAWKAVSVVPACGSSLNAETDREFLEWIRREYAGAEPSYARTLLMAVGTLDDGNWVPTLIERLEDEDSGLREEALAALRRISGLGFPADAARWRSWYESEARWHSQRRPQLLKLLSSAESPKVLSAVREYSEHRTRRGEMVDELLQVLQHGRPEVRGIVIGALGHLGSPAACPALVDMLGDGDKKVGEAAYQALKSICNCELPRDPDALREMFPRS